MEWTNSRAKGANAELPISAEIIANLWYVIDDQGFIYSLRIALYVAGGSDEAKLELLNSRAYLDYLVARQFPIPARYGTSFVQDDGSKTKFAVIHHNSLATIGGADQLFFDGLGEMGKDLPAQTRLAIPESPMIKITSLVAQPNGELIPFDAIRSG